MSKLLSRIAARGSFRRQIILVFVVGFFLLVSAFSIYLVDREKQGIYRDSSAATTGLAQSLAVSSLSWVLANDVMGLQEVVRSFQSYPGLRYAMVISPTGRVLAHSDATKMGQFVSDEQSLALIKAPPGKRILADDASMADVAVPISVDGRQVGWARVAVGREKISADLRNRMWSNAIFVLTATLLSLLAALLIANRLGSRIGALVKVAEQVRSGNMATRASIPGGADEITLLADNLNQMLSALALNEERLRAASLYTRSLIEASLDPLVTISVEGKITDVNQATENVTGRGRSELTGTDFSDYFTAPEQAREGYRQVFLRGSVTDYPLALRHRDGHVTDVLYNASVYRGEQGQVLGVLAAARDITQQKRAEAARSQLAAIVQSSSDAIIGKTLDGVITSWNKGAEKVYGYGADEIIGKPVTMLAPPSLHAEAVNLLEKVRGGEAVVDHETERIRKDGKRFQVALTLSPIRDDAGHISGISTIARDITQRKLDEAALHRLNRELHAISNCNQILMRAEDEQALLEAICHVICDEAGYRMAWVGYAEMDDAKTVRPIAWAGVEDGYLAQAGITWADTARGRGPAGTTIRSGKSACLQDFSTDPAAAPWHDNALQRGYRSCISLPLKDERENTFGALTIYSTEPGAFTPDEVRLLEELAGDLAFGITVLRTRNERKRAEEALRESEQRYRLVFENSPVSIWEEDFSGVKARFDELRGQGVTDLESYLDQHPETVGQCAELAQIVDVNQAALGLHAAASREDLLGGLASTFTPESFDTFRQELLCLWNGGTEMTGDAVVQTLAGDRRNVTVYFAVCSGYEGTLSRVIVSIVDITQRKRAEKELQEQERHSQSLLRLSRNMEVSQTYADVLNAAQDEVKKIMGYQSLWVYLFTEDKQYLKALVAGGPISDTVMSEEGTATLTIKGDRMLEEIAASKEIVLVEDARTDARVNKEIVERLGMRTIVNIPIMMFDRHLGCVGTGTFGEEGVRVPTGSEQKYLIAMASHMAAALDRIHLLAARKLAEEQLRRSEHGLSEAQRMAHLGSWELNLQSNVLIWSDEIYRIFEIDPEKFGASYEAFLNGIHPDDRDLVNEAYTESVNRKIPYDIVHRLLMKDGRVKYVNEKCETYYGEDGKPLRSVGTVHDITEQKVADIALSALKDDLEHRVRLRTAELEAANKELEAFSYSVSHDLRTPLRAIDGFSRILLDDYTDKLDDEGKRLLKIVRDNTNRMGQLIDDILKFSRVGRLELGFSELDMEKLAREVFEELRPDGAGARLQLEIGPILPATGDAAMLRQVWVNLLSNAIKFSRPRAIARINVGSFKEGDETVYFVKDNGVGFDMQYADKLFGVFQRLHAVTEFEGTGIGLAIVKRIVTRHGGRVWAQGKVDEGATVYFALPTKEKEHG